jgi:hypothetical protein
MTIIENYVVQTFLLLSGGMLLLRALLVDVRRLLEEAQRLERAWLEIRKGLQPR